MKLIKNRFFVFAVLLIITFFLSKWLTDSFFPEPDNTNLWFYSGILMILISIFFIEEYYTSPRNILANLLPLIVIFVAVKPVFADREHDWLWWIGFAYILIVLACSFFSIVLSDDDRSEEFWKNRLSRGLKNIALTFGKGKLVFSAMFLYFLLSFYFLDELNVLALLLFWWFIIVAEPQKLVKKVSLKKSKQENAIGRIISVQSKKVFLTKLFQDSLNTKVYDTVRFKYSVQESQSDICSGFIIDTFLLNDQKWAKVLEVCEENEEENIINYEKNVIYKSEKISIIEDIKQRFVGLIVDNSKIGLINFECYNSTEIKEGDLLEITINKTKIYYQIIQGIAKEEIVENKNETGFIKGEAIQLGTWNNNNYSFEKYGWVPDINSIVLKANTSNITTPEFTYPEYKLGNIPNTTLPAVINLQDTVSHHFAILGVTGAGKSFITHELLRNLQGDFKIICVDFTGEYKEELEDLSIIPILHDSEGISKIEEMIAEKETAAKTKNPKGVLELKKQISDQLKKYIDEFIESESMIGLFELPDLSNTSFILEFTQFFLENIFNYAKQEGSKKICLVLEEAHTVVPETTFLGDLGDFGSSKAIVNKIGQIALQGRKYNVGLVVIAQRTANVSKTVLTQCNTVLCFQAFDETSFTFLGNYLGKELVSALPNLPKYHAVVTGKGVKSNIPMIVDLTREIDTIE